MGERSDCAKAELQECGLKNLTAKLEEGDGKAAKDCLSGIGSLEERVSVLRQIDEINEQNRKSDPELPDLVIGVGTSKAGETRLSIIRQVPGFGDYMAGGVLIFSETMQLKDLQRQYWSKQDKRK